MAATLLSQLQSAAKGLLYPSEQDNPITAFAWPHSAAGSGALDAGDVKKQAHAPAGAKVQTQELEAFFAPITTPQSWHSDEEKKQVQQAQSLETLLRGQLTDLKVYLIGDTDQKAVVVGKTPQGDYAGIMTRTVNT